MAYAEAHNGSGSKEDVIRMLAGGKMLRGKRLRRLMMARLLRDQGDGEDEGEGEGEGIEDEEGGEGQRAGDRDTRDRDTRDGQNGQRDAALACARDEATPTPRPSSRLATTATDLVPTP